MQPLIVFLEANHAVDLLSGGAGADAFSTEKSREPK
jgi:hypothetical protein